VMSLRALPAEALLGVVMVVAEALLGVVMVVAVVAFSLIGARPPQQINSQLHTEGLAAFDAKDYAKARASSYKLEHLTA